MQQQQASNSSALPQSSSTPTTSGSGSSDESKGHWIWWSYFNKIYLVLQQLLTSPNPPKQSPTAVQNAVQARLRTVCIK